MHVLLTNKATALGKSPAISLSPLRVALHQELSPACHLVSHIHLLCSHLDVCRQVQHASQINTCTAAQTHHN
jgi:hypothetical protein